jgi:hypothetical protein
MSGKRANSILRKRISLRMKTRIQQCGLGALALAISMALTAPCLWTQQSKEQNSGASNTAKQDMNAAGRRTKGAAKDAGHGVKQGTKSAYRSTKNGTKKAWNKTKDTTKGAVNGGKAGAKQPD